MDEREKVANKLAWILQEVFNRNMEHLLREYPDEPLTGTRWGLTGMDLAILLLEVEKHFDIRINISEMQDYGLLRFEDWVNLTCQKAS